MKKLLIALSVVFLLTESCKKEEPCYSCQWVRQGKIVPNDTEERCGSDVPDWANRVRIDNPQYYPVCARVK